MSFAEPDHGSLGPAVSRFRKAEKAYPPVMLPHDSVQFNTSAQSKVTLGSLSNRSPSPGLWPPSPQGERSSEGEGGIVKILPVFGLVREVHQTRSSCRHCSQAKREPESSGLWKNALACRLSIRPPGVVLSLIYFSNREARLQAACPPRFLTCGGFPRQQSRPQQRPFQVHPEHLDHLKNQLPQT
jgi:hypothetical protein